MLSSEDELALSKRSLIFEKLLLETCDNLLDELAKDSELDRVIKEYRSQYIQSSPILASHSAKLFANQTNITREKSMQAMTIIGVLFNGLKAQDNIARFTDSIERLNPLVGASLLHELINEDELVVIHYIILSSPECHRVLKAASNSEKTLDNLLKDCKDLDENPPYELYLKLIIAADDLKQIPTDNPRL